MKLHRSTLAFIALLIATSIWGANATVMKITLTTVPVFSLAFLRFFGATLLLLPFVFHKLSFKKHDLPLMLLCAVLGVTLNIGFFLLGIKLSTALNSAIIMATTPLITLFFARLFLKEKISRKLVIGSILGTLGIGIIITKDFAHGLNLMPIGDTFLLLATIAAVAHEVVTKKLSFTYHAPIITFYSFLFGCLSFLPFAVLEFVKNPAWTTALVPSSYFGIFYGILLSSFVAFSLWDWGLAQTDVAKVGFFSYLQPVITTVTAVMFLSEKITITFVIGSVFIVLGLFTAETHIHYHPFHSGKMK